MIPEQFVLLGFALNLIGGYTYIRDTIRGETKPNKVTWFMWALAPLIAFFAQRSAGVGWTNLLTFVVGFNPLLIFLASFINKKSYWKITPPDIVCGLLSLVGLALWLITSNPILAIVFALLGDAFAAVPTLVKSLKYPATESYAVFLFGITNCIITLLATHTFSFTFLAFPVYVLFMDIVLFCFIYPKTNAVLRRLFDIKTVA